MRWKRVLPPQMDQLLAKTGAERYASSLLVADDEWGSLAASCVIRVNGDAIVGAAQQRKL